MTSTEGAEPQGSARSSSKRKGVDNESTQDIIFRNLAEERRDVTPFFEEAQRAREPQEPAPDPREEASEPVLLVAYTLQDGSHHDVVLPPGAGAFVVNGELRIAHRSSTIVGISGVGVRALGPV